MDFRHRFYLKLYTNAPLLYVATGIQVLYDNKLVITRYMGSIFNVC